ncbi:hypothetical protein [Leptospira levettii]|uniref:hypothetical protein n=1 Tax=Leptospira levettii TaxID=2023178 RepID=UPI000F62F0E2|nr:hypothetical protein [Leptospira levettii]
MIVSSIVSTIWFSLFILKKYSILVNTKWIQIKQDEQKVPMKLAEYINRDSLVYTELNLLAVYFKADVSCVFSLHNGGKFNNGLSVQKWSLTHDYSATGQLSFYHKILKYKDQLISQSEWIASGIINEEYFFTVDEMEESSAWRREFVRNGIKHGVLKLVETDDNPELIVALFFRSTKAQTELESNNHILRESSDKISSILKDGVGHDRKNEGDRPN